MGVQVLHFFLCVSLSLSSVLLQCSLLLFFLTPSCLSPHPPSSSVPIPCLPKYLSFFPIFLLSTKHYCITMSHSCSIAPPTLSHYLLLSTALDLCQCACKFEPTLAKPVAMAAHLGIIFFILPRWLSCCVKTQHGGLLGNIENNILSECYISKMDTALHCDTQWLLSWNYSLYTCKMATKLHVQAVWHCFGTIDNCIVRWLSATLDFANVGTI